MAGLKAILIVWWAVIIEIMVKHETKQTKQRNNETKHLNSKTSKDNSSINVTLLDSRCSYSSSCERCADVLILSKVLLLQTLPLHAL